MRRRLTVAMVLMVLATLVLSGLFSLAFAVHSTTTQTRRELQREAQGLAVTVQNEADTANRTDPARALRNVLNALRSPLRLDGSAVVAVRTTGQLFDPAAPRQRAVLPARLTAAQLQPARLLRLIPVSGQAGGAVFAAFPYRTRIDILGTPRSVVQVVVLTRRPPSALAVAGPWFALSSLVILIVAGVVASRLGRRFVRPLRAAQEVTSRIAAGDLDARVPRPPGTDPELAALVDSVNSMALGLGRARQAERHFLQSVSHDLRTPLTSIRGFAEAIEDGATADAVAAAGVIASEARRLERLVADLLALGTLEARRFTLQTGPVDLTESAVAAAAAFAPAAAELGLALAVDADPAPCVVMADPDRLAQVIANLVENALRYAGSAVRVGTRHRSGEVDVWVSDDGPGIPSEMLPQVFDRLFVARPRPDRPIGSGLGLTIVAELVRAMGGRVRAESPAAVGGGTRMVVTLPAASVPPGPPAGPAQRNGRVGNRPPSTGSGSDPSTRSSTVA
ncbi:MAG TPA: HAMP domain-containing sensor histidine kinase [Acidimicrobiales bacterium]|nr:HAMP domain-containing sensor histidine kinase [Acidimicrobiales bacterium]